MSDSQVRCCSKEVLTSLISPQRTPDLHQDRRDALDAKSRAVQRPGSASIELKTAIVTSKPTVDVPNRVSSKSAASLLQCSSSNASGPTIDQQHSVVSRSEPQAINASIKSRKPTDLVGHPRVLQDSSGHAHPFTQPRTLSVPSKLRRPELLRVGPGLRHTRVASSPDKLEGFHADHHPHLPVSLANLPSAKHAASTPQNVLLPSNSSSTSQWNQDDPTLRTKDVIHPKDRRTLPISRSEALANPVNAVEPLEEVFRSRDLLAYRQSVSTPATDIATMESHPRRSDVSDIISLYLTLSRSPSLRSLPAPPRHPMPSSRSLSIGPSPSRRFDLPKLTAMLEHLRRCSTDQHVLSRKKMLIDVEVALGEANTGDDTDSDTESEDITQIPDQGSRRGSTTSGQTVAAAAGEWVQGWLNRRLSRQSIFGDPEANLTTRPMYRKARQQASSEEQGPNSPPHCYPMDGAASRDADAYTPLNNDDDAEPGPESMERVIKGLEDVLQEAVDIAQEASNSSIALPPSNTFNETKLAGSCHTDAMDRQTVLPPKSKKRSSDFSDFINEYHHTLTWLSSKNKPRSLASTTRPTTTPTVIEEADPMEEAWLRGDNVESVEPPISYLPLPKGIESQQPSQETTATVSPISPPRHKRTKSKDRPSGLPLPLSSIKRHDNLPKQIASRDFATMCNSGLADKPSTSSPKTDTKAVVSDPHKPADQRIRHSEVFDPK